jgi:hypothetical protein
LQKLATRLPHKQSAIDHAFTQVKNAPPTSQFLLQHEISLTLYNEYQIAIKAHFETLNCLLDREIAVRRQIDHAVEEAGNFNEKKNLRQPHQCEGRIRVVGSLGVPLKFRQCNRLCQLTSEGRAKLVVFEELLFGVHAQ